MNGPVFIAAGGTGGHIFPALAVARRLRDEGVPVIWLGTQQGLEARIVPDAGFDTAWIRIGGVRGKNVMTRLLAPFVLLRACADVFRVLRRYRPAAMLGMGGFVAGPAGLVAWLTRCPLVIHEQNAVAGLTNRVLAYLADRVLEAMPGTFPRARNAQPIGNPVRADIAALPEPAQRFAGRSGALRLLVLGGSQGARTLNELLPAALGALPDAERPEVLHQCGPVHLAATRATYAEAGVTARVEPFIEDMAAAYGWADLVVARAGAMTVAELAAAGVAALLVPFPYAVDDHQTANAQWLVRAGAARIEQERDLDLARLQSCLSRMLNRETLQLQAERARSLAVSDAAGAVIDQIREVAR